jgi:putative peptidoglycan lipid II flippase
MFQGTLRRGLERLAALLRHPLSRPATSLLLVAVAVKCGAFVKELLVAARFGAGDAADAFAIAFLLPALLINVLGHALATAFTPVFVRLEANGRHAEAGLLLGQLTRRGLVWLTAAAAVLALLVAASLPALTAGFDPSKRELTRHLLALLAPIVMIRGTSALWGAALLARKQCLLVGGAQICPPACAALTLVLLPAWGVHGLAVGTTAGFAIEAALLRWRLARDGIVLAGGRAPAAEAASVLAQFWPVLAASLLASSTLLVDQAMAASLAPGSVATLSYGNKLAALLTALAASSLGSALLPHWARLAAADDRPALRRTLQGASFGLLIVSVPAVLALAAASPWIVATVFERGAFTAQATSSVAQIQAVLVLQLPGFLLSLIASSLLHARQASRLVTGVWAASAVLNAAGNWVLMRWFGLVGIAASTTGVRYLSAVAMFYLAWRLVLRPSESSDRVLAADDSLAAGLPSVASSGGGDPFQRAA